MNQENTAMRNVGKKRAAACAVGMGLITLLAGCTPPEQMLSPSISGYNHTHDQSLYYYTVNGNMGAGLGPGGGGGSFSCCVSIPRYWEPGTKVKVWWMYQGGTRIPPEPPPHVAEVELPPYKPSDVGSLQVHFYPDQKIRVYVSRYSINHPDYPADLKWDMPTPADAVAGTPLPFPPEDNPEPNVTRPGETYPQRVLRVEEGLKRAEARRQAKQTRWDALVARKAAGLPIDPASLPPLLPPEPMWDPSTSPEWRSLHREAAPAPAPTPDPNEKRAR